jgi:hypothetical protein
MQQRQHRETGNVNDLVKEFTAFPAKRLIVLGRAGSGKTWLVHSLALGLLATRTYEGPVPLVLPLYSWDPFKEDLQDWIIRRVREDYPGFVNTKAYGHTAASQLLFGGDLLPILDGLDEMAEPQRIAAVKKLRDLPADFVFLLTCRTSEFDSLNRRGKIRLSSWMIGMEPLTYDVALTYLATTNSRWASIRTLLDSGTYKGVLAEVLSNPFMIALSAVAFKEGDPAQLVDSDKFPSARAVERHLLRSYVASSFTSTKRATAAELELPRAARPLHVWRSVKAVRWLQFLARQALSQGRQDVRWETLPETVRSRRIIFACIGLPTIAWACFFYRWITVGHPTWTVEDWLVGAFFLVLTPLVPAGSPSGRYFKFMPLLDISYGVVAAFGVGVGVVTWKMTGAPLLGLGAFISAVALGQRLTIWIGARTMKDERVRSPREMIRKYRRSSITGALCFGVALGVLVATPIIPGIDTTVVVPAATVGCTLLLIATSSWGQFVDARIVAAFGGFIPFRFVTFLEDAKQLGLLRQIGGTYEFRHQDLANYLTST